jgi:hypothetical protein
MTGLQIWAHRSESGVLGLREVIRGKKKGRGLTGRRFSPPDARTNKGWGFVGELVSSEPIVDITSIFMYSKSDIVHINGR